MREARPGSYTPPKECPESDICESTRTFLLDLQRKKQFLSREDVEEAMKNEHKMLMRHRQPPRTYDVEERGVKYATWQQEMRAEAYRRLRRFAGKASWMPFPKP